MNQIDFITPFLDKHHDTNSLLDGLARLTSVENITISTIPFGTEDSLPSLFSRHFKGREITQIYQNDGLYFFKLEYRFKTEGENKSGHGQFFVCNHEPHKNIYLVITIEDSIFFRRALMPFIRSLYPKVYLTFIKHDKLRSLLLAFRERYSALNMIISRASLKNRFVEQDRDNRLVPMVGWPNMELDEAFKWATQNDSWFQSIQFRLLEKNTSIAEISFTRQGIVRTNHLYNEVLQFFISPVCRTLHENMEMFSHRSRRERETFSVRPIAIRFDYDQFLTPEENKKFIQVMKNYNKAAVSVLHGNPYIHLTTTDYYDGSNFDIWMVSPETITIVPQMKGSIAAIKRLVSHIFDNYAEGKIMDYKEVRG